MSINIGIFIYDQAEVLDFSGPFEVFTTASRVSDGGAPFHVFLVGESGLVVEARGGFRVLPAYSFQDHPPIDLLIVPGGVHGAEMEKSQVLEWIQSVAASAQIVTSVCTGVFLLSAASVLTSEKVTTHWEDIPTLRETFPALQVQEDVRWVDEGDQVTSGGISAGIDMSLHLVGRLQGVTLAEKAAWQMEYDWAPGATEVT